MLGVPVHALTAQIVFLFCCLIFILNMRVHNSVATFEVLHNSVRKNNFLCDWVQNARQVNLGLHVELHTVL